MGSSSGLSGGSWDLDDSSSDLPYFEDDLGTWKPSVLAWTEANHGKSTHMPMGLGGARADMGMYGGPNNQYWGAVSFRRKLFA